MTTEPEKELEKDQAILEEDYGISPDSEEKKKDQQNVEDIPLASFDDLLPAYKTEETIHLILNIRGQKKRIDVTLRMGLPSTTYNKIQQKARSMDTKGNIKFDDEGYFFWLWKAVVVRTNPAINIGKLKIIDSKVYENMMQTIQAVFRDEVDDEIEDKLLKNS